ncbi:DUF3006 domain-containing protein [Halobacillus sp. H74]|uniref:DUF3006 domain-containing protein n=1 Tax=Halobacillus sp. H74 TaxID=3457436 RepID=UPI003FCE798E
MLLWGDNIKYTIDRFEGELAVILKKGNETIQKDVPLKYFTEDVSEGDIVEKTAIDGITRYIPLKEETKCRNQEAESLLEKIKKKNK